MVRRYVIVDLEHDMMQFGHIPHEAVVLAFDSIFDEHVIPEFTNQVERKSRKDY